MLLQAGGEKEPESFKPYAWSEYHDWIETVTKKKIWQDDLVEKVLAELGNKGKPILYTEEGIESISKAVQKVMDNQVDAPLGYKSNAFGQQWLIDPSSNVLKGHKHDDLVDAMAISKYLPGGILDIGGIMFSTNLSSQDLPDTLKTGDMYNPDKMTTGTQFTLECSNCKAHYIASWDHPTHCPICFTGKENAVVMGPAPPAWEFPEPIPVDPATVSFVPNGMHPYLPVVLVFRMSDEGHFEGLIKHPFSLQTDWSPNVVRVFTGANGPLSADYYCKVHGAFQVNPFEVGCPLIIDWHNWLKCQGSGQGIMGSKTHTTYVIKD
jgi:hypothetical protein